jgi:secreted PhoX family phosphatase
MHRRTFLRQSAILGGGLAVISPFEALGVRAALGAPPVRITGYGPLVPKGELALPAAFNYRVISRQGEPMRDGAPTPSCFDGMGAFPGPHGTTILIRNHENRLSQNPQGVLEIPVIVPPGFAYDEDPRMRAGCTKLVVRREAEGVYAVVDQFAIQGGTDNNCAGGVLPFKKWLTCEEVVRRGATGKKHGYVFEVDATSDGPIVALPIIGAGRFAHEATVWRAGILYETEDRRLKPTVTGQASQGGSLFYRYIPDHRVGQSGNLAQTTGVLQALKLKDEFHANMDVGRVVGVPYEVEWVTIDAPDHEDDTDNTPIATRFQGQAKGAAVFDRMEGAWAGTGDAKIYFDCTVGGEQYMGQVWEYDPGREVVTLMYESQSPETLEGPDNVVVVPQTGDVLLCEDANAPQYVRGLTQSGELYDFAQNINNDTEFAGACFDPDGQTLYLNQYGQRGDLPSGPPGHVAGTPQGGVTYAIYGPFEKREGNRSRRL